MEDRCRRLLRWYPASWRAENGEVLLGTLLDVAEAERRERPSAGEAWSIRFAGAGERLTPRAGLTLGCIALVLAACAQAVNVAGATFTAPAGDLLPLMLSGLAAPVLLSAAILAGLRHGRKLLPARAVGVLLAGTAAWALSFLTAWSWSVGFDEADAGMTRSPLASAFLPLFLSAWVVGALALTLLLGGLAVGLPRPVRWSVSFVAALFTPPVLGAATTSPLVSVLVAGAVVAAFAGLLSHPSGSARGSIRRPGAPAPRGVRRRVAVLAGISLGISLLGVGFALTGGAWAPGFDGTRAMRIGLIGGSLAFVPLLFAAGSLLSLRRPSARGAIWIGVLLMVTGIGAHAVSTMSGLAGSGDRPWWTVLPAAAGVGVLTAGVMGLRPGLRLLVGIAISAAVLFPIWSGLVAGALLVHFAAAGLLVWGCRRPRPSTRIGPPLLI